MNLYYIGNGSEKLGKRALARGFSLATGECKNPERYDAFLVNDGDPTADYLWSQVPDKVWFPNPFKFRNSKNTLYQYGIAKSFFKVGNIQTMSVIDETGVNFYLPDGFEYSVFVSLDVCVPISRHTIFKMNKNVHKRIRNFVNCLDVPFGIVTLHIDYLTESLYFKEFSPIVHWDYVSSEVIDSTLSYMQFLVRSYKHRR